MYLDWENPEQEKSGGELTKGNHAQLQNNNDVLKQTLEKIMKNVQKV